MVNEPERLRVLLSVAPWASSPAIASEHLSDDDLRVLEGLCPDDLALANACYEVEADLRDRGCAALSELAAVIANSPGSDLDERIHALPEPELFSALRCIVDLGWIHLERTNLLGGYKEETR